MLNERLVYWGDAMYIWILLATIMVALSFFNVPPRADKEHALNDVKAATVVNRFKAEHEAMLKNFDCEIIFRQNNQAKPDGARWDPVVDITVGRTSSKQAVDVTKFNPSAAATGELRELMLPTGDVYTKLTQHLPMGYVISNRSAGYSMDSNAIHHLIFCLKKDATEATSDTDFIACDSDSDQYTKLGYYRYMVSFARIKNRWVSHDEPPTPLPTLVNLLSKTPGSTAVFGWTDCYTSDKGCILRGHEAYTNASEMVYTDETYTDQKTGTEQKVQKPVPIILPPEALFWKNSVFKETCDADHPCLFAYEVFPFVDTACHCWNMLHPDDKKYGDDCHTSTIVPYQPHH